SYVDSYIMHIAVLITVRSLEPLQIRPILCFDITLGLQALSLSDSAGGTGAHTKHRLILTKLYRIR
ncbi:hypothetical protein ACJX0J_020506, partial [Zea mays]